MGKILHAIAMRWRGIKELPGNEDNPFILGMLRLDAKWPDHDEVAWCSAFVNFLAWQLGLERTRSLRARSWLLVGERVAHKSWARQGDIVILTRGSGPQPGPEEIEAPGHVAVFDAWNEDRTRVRVIGGNQGNTVSLAWYSADRVLGIRRLGAA